MFHPVGTSQSINVIKYINTCKFISAYSDNTMLVICIPLGNFQDISYWTGVCVEKGGGSTAIATIQMSDQHSNSKCQMTC